MYLVILRGRVIEHRRRGFAGFAKEWRTMMDRQKLETILARRFPGSLRDQIAAAANAIMGLADEWEEVGDETMFGYRFEPACTDICGLAREVESGAEFRLLRRRTDA
jgi:hypothetical protein